MLEEQPVLPVFDDEKTFKVRWVNGYLQVFHEGEWKYVKTKQPRIKKNPGRPRKYERLEDSKHYINGAPVLHTRVEPDVLEWIKKQPEGTRKYIDNLVRKDMAERKALLPSTQAGQA